MHTHTLAPSTPSSHPMTLLPKDWKAMWSQPLWFVRGQFGCVWRTSPSFVFAAGFVLLQWPRDVIEPISGQTACQWTRHSLFHWRFGRPENIVRGINGGRKPWYGYLNTLNSNWPRTDKDTCSPLGLFPWTELENTKYWFFFHPFSPSVPLNAIATSVLLMLNWFRSFEDPYLYLI